MGTDIAIGIVEDEIIVADSIVRALTELGYKVLPPANTFDEALEMIICGKPDLIMLDILLGKGKDGIDLATKINDKLGIPFIYLTANADKQTVERAKVTMPAAFLVKPFTKYDLYASIEIAIMKFHNSKSNPSSASVTFIKDGNTMRKIPLQEIIYLEADHVYLNIHTHQRKFLIRTSLQEFLSQLNSKKFLKVHRSYAINIDYVAEIKQSILVVNNKEIPLSRAHKNDLLAALKGMI